MAQEVPTSKAAQKAASASAARKTVDKWKKKKWFIVTASKIFDSRPIGETPGEKPKNVLGRTMRVTLDVVTGNRAKRDYVISFKINDVQGQNASTVVSAFEVNKGTLGRTVRRRNSKVALTKKIPVVGGEAMTTVVVVTEKKATRIQEAAVRKITHDTLVTHAGRDFELFAHELLLGNFANDVLKAASKVCAIKRVIVSKSVFTQAK